MRKSFAGIEGTRLRFDFYFVIFEWLSLKLNVMKLVIGNCHKCKPVIFGEVS